MYSILLILLVHTLITNGTQKFNTHREILWDVQQLGRKEGG